jgi:hypothetical protein
MQPDYDKFVSMTPRGKVIHFEKTHEEVITLCTEALECNDYEVLEVYEKVSIVQKAKPPIEVIKVK